MTNTETQIDTLILATASDTPIKTAALISKIYDALPSADITPHKDSGKEIAERIYILVDNGRLEAKGNMRRWRDSEITLCAAPSKAQT